MVILLTTISLSMYATLGDDGEKNYHHHQGLKRPGQKHPGLNRLKWTKMSWDRNIQGLMVNK